MLSNQQLLQTNYSIHVHTTNKHSGLFCQFHVFFSSPYHLLFLEEGKEETIEGIKLFLVINEVKHGDQPFKKQQLKIGKIVKLH